MGMDEDSLQMFPALEYLSQTERDEFEDLVVIVQNLSGIEWIASNSSVMFDPLCKPFTDRMRALSIKNLDLKSNWLELVARKSHQW